MAFSSQRSFIIKMEDYDNFFIVEESITDHDKIANIKKQK